MQIHFKPLTIFYHLITIRQKIDFRHILFYHIYKLETVPNGDGYGKKLQKKKFICLWVICLPRLRKLLCVNFLPNQYRVNDRLISLHFLFLREGCTIY